MPHRVASPTAVTFAEPRLGVAGQLFGPGEPVVPWDYLRESTVMSSVSVDVAAFLTSTGLSTLSGVTAQVQVDCRTTGSRHIARVPLPQGGRTVSMEVRLGPHQVAHQIEVTQSVVLDTPDGEETPDLVAFRRGSRLLSTSKTFRFILEGSASTFPTEAFDFGAAGLPSDAAWKLQFEPESLDEPYLAAVRLFVNSSHPSAPELLSGKPSLVQSVLFHAIVEQLLLSVADGFATDIPPDFQVDSVGEALNHLAHVYLGVPLPAAVALFRGDRAETLCRLQAGTSFLALRSS